LRPNDKSCISAESASIFEPLYTLVLCFCCCRYQRISITTVYPSISVFTDPLESLFDDLAGPSNDPSPSRAPQIQNSQQRPSRRVSSVRRGDPSQRRPSLSAIPSREAVIGIQLSRSLPSREEVGRRLYGCMAQKFAAHLIDLPLAMPLLLG
jgi:hypothetical protein